MGQKRNCQVKNCGALREWHLPCDQTRDFLSQARYGNGFAGPCMAIITSCQGRGLNARQAQSLTGPTCFAYLFSRTGLH
jgi:hypothetical protein